MSRKSFSNLTVVVPVFRGGLEFIEALLSIERSELLPNNIVVSFNEVGDKDYQVFNNALLTGKLKSKYMVFRTCVEMKAHHHGRFIVEKLKSNMSLDAMILFLAHDDRILWQPQTEMIKSFFSTLVPNVVYFPSYSCCRIQDYERIIEVIESEETISPEEFFWRTQRQNVPTSMSGMIVPLAAWDEALGIMGKSGSGARFEHLLAIARPVNSVRFHRFIKTLIVSRPDSDAANLTLLEHRWASIYYLFTFARNARLSGLCNHINFIGEIMKKFAAICLAYSAASYNRILRLHRDNYH